MLKPYTKQEDVPAELREHYSKREDGLWHADIDDSHPAVKHNAKLLSEKSTAISERDTAKSELESARGNSLPRGHVAVTKADSELLEKIKPLGTFDEINAKLTEHGTLKETEAKRAKTDKLHEVAEVMGWNPKKTALLLADRHLPDLEIRTDSEGKKSVVAKVKQADNTFVEKPFADVVKTTEALSILTPALAEQKASGDWITQADGDAPATGDFLEQHIKERDKARSTDRNPLMPAAKAAPATTA